MSIKNKIKAANDIDRRSLAIPEWEVTVEVRSMTVRQRASFIAANQDTDDSTNRIESMYGQMLMTCVYDPENGEAVFDEDDLDWLLTEKSGAVIDRIVTFCLEVSGLKEKAVDDMGKSSSDSPIDMVSDIPNYETTSN